MRIERLELRHLTSLGHVVLDMTALPAGLIAIVGPNGAGKTTLLESAVAGIYRTLPSRGGELMDYATDRDTAIDVRFAVDGVGAFHSRVSIDGIRRTNEAVLEHQGRPITDGKVTTFDAEVRRRFPSLAVMLASAVAAQNKRGNFISKKPKERKELFAELLALGHLEEMSVTAKALVARIDAKRDHLLATKKELQRVANPDTVADYEATLRGLHADRDQAVADRQRFDADLVALERDAAALEQTIRTHVGLTEKVKTLKRQLESAEREVEQIAADDQVLDTTYDADLRRLTQRAKTQRETVVKKNQETVQDLDNRVGAARKLLRQADAIRTAVATLHELDQRERELRTSLDVAQADQIKVTDERASFEQQLALLAQPEHELAQARSNAMLIDTVPFGARCAEAGCQFLKEAVAGQAAVPELERRLASKPEWVATIQRLSATLAGHRAAAEALIDALSTLANQRASQQSLAKLAEQVTVAETRIAELEQTRKQTRTRTEARLAEMATELADAQADLSARRTAARNTLDERAKAAGVNVDRLRTEVAVATGDMLRTAPANEQAVQLKARITDTRTHAEMAAQRIAAVDATVASLQHARRAYEDAVARLERIDQALATLDTQRIDWQQIHRALGRDGVPVLEMDAAGPRISELTNTLLTACFGPRFSAELVTQQAKASGSGMKESFELLVTDNERGGAPREVGDLSGGEQVIISEALMNAISIFVNEHAAMPIRTCWRDETTGALDTENAHRYLLMLRQVLTLGGYHQIFFVTHNPAIAAQADAQIHLADGTADVRLPPFAEAA